MNKKKIRKILFGLIMACVVLFPAAKVHAEDTTTEIWTRYQNNATNNGVTNHPGPTSQANALSIWENNLNVSMAKTPPLIIGDYLYTASGNKVYCLDKTTGKQVKVSDDLVGSVGFGLHPMVYAKGTLYVMTNANGMVRIEAVHATTLKKLWSSAGVPGDVYSPLTYHEFDGKGYLYTGTWQGIGKKGYYFCVAAENNGNQNASDLVWQNEYQYGFYWDGAYIDDNYMAFASENSQSDKGTAADSTLYIVNPLTGKLIDSMSNLSGNIRNTVTYDNGYLYLATMTGRLYKIPLTSDYHVNNSGVQYIDLGGPIRTTTIVHNNRIYVGVGSKGNVKAHYAVIAGSSLTKSYTIDVAGDPTGTPVLSTAEEDIDGTLYLYYTCNVYPGGLYYFTDKAGQTSGTGQVLFTPADSQQQFSISSLALDTNGTIYYKNDSNYVMAIAPKLINGLTVIPDKGSVNWKDNFEPATKTYQLTAGDNVDRLDFKISAGSDVTCKYTVNGVDKGTNGSVSLTSDTTKVVLTLTQKAITVSYTFNIKKVTASDTSLGLLYFGAKGALELAGKNLLQPITDERTEYSVDLRKTPADNTILWIRSLNSGARVAVYAVENLKKEDSNTGLKAGQELLFDTVDMENTYKYTIDPVDSKKNTVIRVRITSADEKYTKDYTVSFIRADAQQTVTPAPSTPQTFTTQKQTATQASNSTTAKKTTTTVSIKKPKKITGFKVKKTGKKLVLKWKKVKGASGYQIIVAKDKKFRKSKKMFVVKKASLITKKIKYTKKMKYVKIRAYVKKSGKTVYGSYSKILKIK